MDNDVRGKCDKFALQTFKKIVTYSMSERFTMLMDVIEREMQLLPLKDFYG